MYRITQPSPALIVAVIALVAALAGTAVAGEEARTSALTKKKVKKIAKKQINKLAPGLSVLNAETAQNATNADSLDNLDSTDFRRSNEVIGASDLGTIRERSASTAVAPDTFTAARRQCEPGEQFLSGGGGFQAGNSQQVAVLASQFEPPNGWEVFLRNGAAATLDATLIVHVYCLEP